MKKTLLILIVILSLVPLMGQARQLLQLKGSEITPEIGALIKQHNSQVRGLSFNFDTQFPYDLPEGSDAIFYEDIPWEKDFTSLINNPGGGPVYLSFTHPGDFVISQPDIGNPMVVRFEPTVEHWYGESFVLIGITSQPYDEEHPDDYEAAFGLFRITVTSVPDPPKFANLPPNNTFYIDEDTTLTLDFEDFISCIDSAPTNFNLWVAQVQDPIGLDLYNVMVSQPGSPSGHTVTFTPQQNYNNPNGVPFRIKAMDRSSFAIGEIVITLVIWPTNDAPEIVSYYPEELDLELNQNDTQHFEVNAIDVDGDALAHSWILSGTIGGLPYTEVVSATHELDHTFLYPGFFTLTYEVSDGSETTSMVWNITVKPIGPIFDPVPNPLQPCFPNGVDVSLSVPPGFEGATIYYTIDGSDPEMGGATTMIYSLPISVPPIPDEEIVVTIKAFFYLESAPPASQIVGYTYRVSGKVADPVFTPTGGIYDLPVAVTIEASNSGATIYYTTDGSEPVPDSPGTYEYTGPISIPSDTEMTITAIAIRRPCWLDSEIVAQTYNVTGTVTIDHLQLTPPPGYYEIDFGSSLDVAVSALQMTPAGATLWYLVEETLSDNLPGPSIPNSYQYIPGTTEFSFDRPTHIKFRAYAADWQHSITHTFFYDVHMPTKILPFANGTVFDPAPHTSPEPLMVYINTLTDPPGAPIYYTTDGNDPTNDPALRYYGGPITLGSQHHSYTIKAMAHDPSIDPSGIYVGEYHITGQIEMLQFDPVPSSYQNPQNVTISTNTAGTTIYYTTDASADPDQLYTGPVHLGIGVHTLKARAEKEGWDSNHKTGVYRIGYLSPPSFVQQAGTYYEPIVVHLQPHQSVPDVTIKYSLTGAEPFYVYDPAVGIPVDLMQNVTITAYSEKYGWEDSDFATATYNVLNTVAMPTFDPIAGHYQGAQNVQINSSTPGATIRWTLDGQDPSRTYGNDYTGPIAITQSATLKAMAFYADWADSPVNTGVYTIDGNIAKPVFTPAPGLYTSPVDVYVSVNPSTANIYYTTNGDTPDASSTLYDGSPIHIDWDSTVTIKAIAIQSGWTDSEIAEGTYQVTGRVAAPVITPPSGSYMAPPLVSIESTPGATIYYTLDGTNPDDGSTPYTGAIQLTGNTTVKAIAYLADWDPSQISTATYVINPQVATPVFSPPGGTYQEAQNVSITSATPAAVIRYTTDGSEPDETSAIYAGSIAVHAHGILRAKAYKDDHESSGIGTAEYFFMTANPVLTPPSGAYPEAFMVEMSTSTPGAQIRYTINGADPTSTSGTVWDGTPIPINENSTIRAIAYQDGWISSNVVIYSYVINGPVTAPYFSIAGGDYYDILSVNISTLPPTASIYYTTDGSEPSESNGILYDPANPVQIDKITTLRARAYLNNWQPSPISEAQYNLFTRPVVFNPAGGTYPMVQMVTLSSPTPNARIWYTLDDTNPIIAVSPEYDGSPIEIASTTTIKTVARAEDWFGSTIGQATYVIDIPLPSIATPVISPPSGVYDHVFNVTITTSTPDAQIWYTIDGNDPNPDNGILYEHPGFIVNTDTTVHARAFKEGHQVSGLASAYYTVVLPIEIVEMPTFDPEPGVYENSVEVSIATETDGADIYYTTDGGAPNMSSNLYNGALTFTTTTQLRARAYKDGMNPSSVASGYYVINVIIPDVETPIFTPVSGLYHAPIDVLISTGTPDATIRYTTNGSDPVASSPEYTDAIHVDNNQSLFIKARAFKDGHNPSPVASANYNVTGTVADIIFSVPGDTYQTPQSLILTTTTPDVTIRYTTDDSEPTETSPAYVTAIPINSSKTVKARGFKTNWLPSAIGEETYIITGTVAFNQPSLTPAPGTYHNAIDLAIAAPIPADAQVLYTLDGSDPTAGTGVPYTAPIPKDGAENGVFTIKAVAHKDGWIDASISGNYTFVASAPTFDPSSGSYTEAQNVVLASSTLDATIRYTTDGSDPKINGIEYTDPIVIDVNKTILAYASKDGYLDSEVVSATYAIGTHVPMVATPVMTPASGTYHIAQSVEIEVSTPDAVIYYTLDGSEPTQTSSLYTVAIPLDLNSSKTIKAKAFKPDWLPSATATERYVITGQVAAPTFNPPAGDYYNAQNVVLLSATEGAYFRYTTDGNDPDETSTLYVTPINVPAGEVTTIKARAYKADWLDSEIGTAVYNVTGKVAFTPPVITPTAGNYDSAQTITISAPIPAAATVRYTIDGSTPSATHGIIYTSPFSLDTTATVKAIAYLDGWANSDVVSAHYNFGVIAPVFAPVSGTYPALTVSITSATEGALIRYTLDGTEPSETMGELYSAPMEMAGDATYNFKAIAYKEGWQNSIVVPATYNVTGQVADVAFSVPSGTYTTAQYLVLSSATPGAAIYYTLDGNEPTQSSTLYTTAITIPLNTSMVIRARAYRNGWLPSGITQGQYNVTGTTAFDQPHFTPAPGTYHNAISVSIAQPIPANAQVYYTTDGTPPSADNGTLYMGSIPMDSALTLRAVAIREGWLPSYISGNYDFMAAAPTFLPPAGSYETTQHVVLSSGTLGSTIRYTTDGTDPSLTNGMDYSGSIVVNINQTIKAYAYKPGYQDSPIVIATYAIGTYVPVVATPVFDPLPGNFTEAVEVAISTATPDATIHYTLDGSNPTAGSPEYVSPIIVPEHSMMTIKAIAFKEEWDASQIAVGTYNVTGTVSEVIFTPAGGNYQSAQQVVLTSLTDGAYFRYTLDGTEPTNSSPLYTTAITVPLNSSVTITARAYKSGWAPSAVGSQTYNVTGKVTFTPPVITPTAGNYDSAQTITISAPIPAAATVRYTIDGSTPSATHGIIYTGPFSLDTTATVKAIAYLDGWANSDVVSAHYNFGVIAPVFAPVSGTYPALTVSITSATEGALIRYTLDGTEPSETVGELYSAPMEMAGDATYNFKAIAYKEGWQNSIVVPATYNVTGQVADVAFSVPSGTYTTAQYLVLSSATPGAAIYYTLDGNEPTQSSTLYTTAITIPLNTSMVIRARAYRNGWLPSGITQGQYNVTGTTAFDQPHFTPAPGTYHNAISVSIAQPIPANAQVYYTTDGTPPSADNGTLYTGSIPMDSALTLRAVAIREGWLPSYISGNYDFMAAAPTFLPPAGSYETTQHVVLSSGTLGSTIRYTTDGTDPSLTNGMDYSGSIVVNINQTIKAYAYKPGYQDSPIVIATYAIGTYVPVVATPVFDPLPGNFTEAVEVAISTATPDATIHYTLDGSNPTAGSPEYISPITVPEHSMMTIKAIAFKEEWDASQIAVGTYNVTGTVSEVIFTPAGGNYQSAQQVVLTSLTDGAYFRYALDGTEPTNSSPLYTTAITVPLNSSVTITARAYKSGWAPSAVGSQTYNVTGQVSWPAMVFTPAGGTYPAPVEVSIALPNPADATIRYTLDGSNPSATNGTVYTGAPIFIGENSTLKAIAFKEGWGASSIASAAYQFGVALPVFTPAAGTYQNSIDVSISSTTPAALIRYTTDGTNPTPEHGNVYLSPITLPEDSVTLFKAIAYLDNWNASAVVTANYIITGKVSDVTFSIPSGTYTTSQILVLNTTTPGASIYYTLDGSEPTQGSTLYTSAIIIPQNSQMTVKARAFRSGWIPSNITSGVYNVTGTTAFTTPNFIPAPGTYGNPINVGIGSAIPSDAAIYYTIDGTEPSPSNGTLYSAPIPVNEALTIRAVAVKDGWVSGHISGEYTFAAAAPVFNPPAGSYPTTQHVVLSSATVGALIRYTTDGSDPSPTNGESYTGSIVVNINQTIKAYAYKAGYEDSPIAIGTYAIGTYVPVVATPVFNPLPGNYVAPIDVTISTSTADATIRYTTDGSTPTPSSPVFTSAIHIPNHTAVTIRAIAYKDEWDDSQMAVATYSVTGTVEDVVFSPEGGAYTTAQNVVLTTPTPGAAIFYTLNGDTPTDASTQYTQAIQVPLNSSVTIRAVAYKNGWMFSSVGSQTYNITGQVVIPGQVFNPVAGTYTQPQIVTIATATIPVGATIRYTVNGDDPTIDSPEYTGQTIIAGLNAITTVKARAFLTGWVDSPVYEAVYNVTGTIQLPAVVFTPPAGTYQTAQNVTLNAPTVPAGVSYYYTTDGSDPTDASLLYQGPIPLPLDSGITQIKVRAYKEGWVPSAVASATYNITGTVVYMTPVFLPPAGTYQTAQQITINSVNPSDATVRYTLDGSEPTQTSPIYTSPITLPLESGTTTIKTKAFKTDWTASQTHSATYTITGQVSIAAPVFDPIPGTYVNPQSVAVIPYVTPATAQIRYTLDGSDPTPTSPVYSGEIPAPAYTTTRIKVRAYATDWAPSPVYEGIYVVNGAASINGVVFTPPAGTYTTAQRLVISTNTLPIDADIYYTIDGSDPTSGSTPYTTPIHLDLDREITVKVRAYGDQYWDPSPVYTAHYVMTGRVQIPEPVFSPDPSVVYTEATMVTIDEPIPAAATVRYTLDGSDPDESSTIYDGQIGVPLNTVMQIKARAYLSDWDASPIYSATYTLSGKVELADQPFSPAPGIYTAAQQIAIATPVLPDNGIIRYTINGDDPDETSVQYTGPITIPLDSDWQIKIRGFAPNWIPSDVMTAHYVVTGVVEDPVFVVNGEIYTGAEEYLSSEAINIVLETSTAGARIYYTMAMGSDPEEPTTASQLFDAENPIVISELDLDVRIRAKAFKEHWIDSEDDTHSFTVIPAPYNVRSLSYGGYIRLLWNSDISTRGLDGFNIYRRKTTESSWTKINSSLVNSKLGDDYYYDDYAIENRVSYVYRVTAVYSGKEGPYSNTTAIEYQTSELEISSATHAYPNPATNSTNIKLMLTRNDNVTVSVSIYDFGGKKIRTITVPATNSNMIEIPWDLMNSSGKKVGRGTYFARIIANDGVNKAERTIKISVK